MKSIISGLAFLILIPVLSLAGSLKGVVTINSTGEPATGAVVSIEGKAMLTDVAGINGAFNFENIQSGIYVIHVDYMGYKSYQNEVNVDQTQTLIIILEEDIKSLHEVQITARKEASAEHTARGLERNADQVMNIISGKAIQLSPDLTVANVVQRISGISIERNSNGDGQHAILRGMDKRYNYTLVNGVKIPSPDNKYRYVPLDIFPAELLDRLEVTKALTPDMEGDAVGGVINMVMKDAPARFAVTANLAGGYNELFFDRDFASFDYKSLHKQSPYELNGNTYNATPSDFSKASYDLKSKSFAPNLIGGLSIGDRFLNNRLGIILAGSYQNTFRGSNSIFNDIEKVDTFSGVTLTKYSQRQYSEQQIRGGVHLKADYVFNERNKLQWYNAYMSLNNIQVRDVTEMQLTIGGYDPVKGNATMGYSTRTRYTAQSIYNSTLHGEHGLSPKLTLDWSAVYSVAKQETPENATTPLLGVMQNFVQTKTYILDATKRWEHNSDRDITGYANLKYKINISHIPVTWTLGGMFRDKKRDNFYNQYQLRPSNLQAIYGKDFMTIADIQWVIQNPRGSAASALTYNATEQIGAGFLQFKAMFNNLDVIGGVRGEHTNQGYTMLFPIGEDRPDGNQQYLDILPSLHFKYAMGSNTNLRASYFRSINRPGFFEIVPYKIVNEEYQERGNPDLKRAIADNIDFRYELYPGVGEQLMGSVFYKRIKDPIEYTLQRDPVRGQDIFYAPGNFGTANNYGLEIDAIKYFKKWGVKANYTYTHSAITTDKSKRIRDEAGNLQTITVEQTRPLYGQAAHIANLSLIYKDPKKGWDIQLAGNFTGERIVTVSQFVNNDFWQRSFVQLDFSLEKTVGKNWVVFAKVNNILNTPMEVYMKEGYNNTDAMPEQTLQDQTLIRRDYYQRSYLLGVRWKL